MEKPQEKKTSLLFEFEMRNGSMVNWSKEIFRDQYSMLKDGKYKHKVETVSTRYTATRWKYLYDCVYKLALPTAKKFLRIQKGATQRELQDEKDLHNCMLSFFNSVVIVDLETNKIASSTESSTKLTDDAFWFPFVENISLYFSENPYFLDVPDYETWKEIRANGGRAAWDKFTGDFFENQAKQNENH